MPEQLNYVADLGTLARHALMRELLADGIDKDESRAVHALPEIRVRGVEHGTFRRPVTSPSSLT